MYARTRARTRAHTRTQQPRTQRHLPLQDQIPTERCEPHSRVRTWVALCAWRVQCASGGAAGGSGAAGEGFDGGASRGGRDAATAAQGA
eukprot:5443524-Prymnesium_polylepis.1